MNVADSSGNAWGVRVSKNSSNSSTDNSGLFLFLGAVGFILAIEMVVWVVSLYGTKYYLRWVLDQAEATPASVLIDQASEWGTQFIVLLVMVVLTITLVVFLTVLRKWVFEPVEIILDKNEQTKSGRPELIPSRRIPTNEIGLLMESRNDMLRALDQLFSEQAIETLVQAVDAKDPYTQGHSRRVGSCAQSIGKELGMTEAELEKLNYSGTLHDIGKIGIDDAILTKPEGLTDEEFSTIQEHPEKGGEILQYSHFDEKILDGVLYHHEQYDGSGYPEGLSGPDIPVFGRILAVADAIDAMFSDRAYREKLDPEIVFAELEENQESQFDPQPAQAALRLLKDKKPGHLPDHYLEIVGER